MYVELVPSSTKLCWFVPIDYTDPETPLPRRFMVEFLNDEERERFRGVFMNCSKEMHGHIVNHKLVSLLAAGSPRKESPSIKTPGKSVSFQQSPEILEGMTPEPQESEPELQETPKKEAPETRPHNICANLKQEFEEYSHEILNEPQEAAPIAPQDTSVEIIREVLPSADKQAKESELSLPKGFFNYEHKESCSGCVGCDEDDVVGDETPDNNLSKSPSPPPAHEVIPALDPASQLASPFSFSISNSPVNSFTSVSQGTNLFGNNSSPSPFTTPPANNNIFLKNQPTSGNANIFLQGNTTTSTDNIFLKSKNTENIFLKSAPVEENIFLRSSDPSPAAPQQTVTTPVNPFASPPMPSLPAKSAEYGDDNENYEEDYEYDEEDYDDYDDDNNYNAIQED